MIRASAAGPSVRRGGQPSPFPHRKFRVCDPTRVTPQFGHSIWILWSQATPPRENLLVSAGRLLVAKEGRSGDDPRQRGWTPSVRRGGSDDL